MFHDYLPAVNQGFGRPSKFFVLVYELRICLEKRPTQQMKLGGGFKYFLFSPLPGEDSHFD